ncbi:Discs large 1, isoform L, partial [Operophtera brumata]
MDSYGKCLPYLILTRKMTERRKKKSHNGFLRKVSSLFNLDTAHVTTPEMKQVNGIEGGGTGIQNEDGYIHLTVVLSRAGGAGLGFSIAGGSDNPHVAEDPHIYVTKLIPGGAAAASQLLINDAILSVNDVNVVNVTHADAVDALKKAGSTVKLKVKRRAVETDTLNVSQVSAKEESVEIELVKGGAGLGFSIAGGLGNQHIPGDNGIYVTKIMAGGAAHRDGRLRVGDKLLMVKNTSDGDVDLDNVTHEDAVAALKATGERVVLVLVPGPRHGQPSPRTSRANTPTASSAANSLRREDVTDSAEETRVVELEKGTQATASSAANSLRREDVTDSAEETRVVELEKGTQGLGFNIVGGEDGHGIYVSFLLAGGPAERSGELRRGDRLLASQSTLERKKKTLSFSRKFPFMKSREDGKSEDGSDQEREILYRVELPMMEEITLIYLEDECQDESVLSYETVQQLTITYTRPVIILGPLKDRINDDLISEFPDKFGSCINYRLIADYNSHSFSVISLLFPTDTTRPRRDYEVDGRDYHFVASREQMERDIQNHLEMNKRMTEEQAKKTYERALKMEQ